MYNLYYEVRVRPNSSYPEISICFHGCQCGGGLALFFRVCFFRAFRALFSIELHYASLHTAFIVD
jgi:hypothetical protein